MNRNIRDEILAELEPLFEKANRERRWFYLYYQALTLPPKELRACHARGEFIWGAVNWKLIDPPPFANLELERDNLIKYNEDLKKRIDEGWET